eukprot:m.455565 g.455565  ORF g.455565 m.455565 type:complete len:517 (-) comp20893_c0_seq1:47-1597(-)
MSAGFESDAAKASTGGKVGPRVAPRGMQPIRMARLEERKPEVILAINPTEDPSPDDDVCSSYLGISPNSVKEIYNLWGIWTAICGNTFMSETLGPVSVMFIGRLGATKLGAAVIAIMWTNSSGVALLGGMAGALDTQCSQAFGSGEMKLVGLHFLRGCIVLTMLCLIVLTMWLTVSRPILNFFAHGDVEQTEQALPYVWYSTIGLWPSVMYRATSKWLQAQDLGRGPMIAATYGALANPVLNYVFIFVYDGGLTGAAIANSMCWIIMLMVLLLRTWRAGIHKQTLYVEKITQQELCEGWFDFLRLGIPSAAIVCFEWWSWEMSTIIASRIGRLELAVHGVILNIGNLYYTMFPLSISQTAAVRVGYFIGKGSPLLAKESARITIRLTAIMMAVIASLMAMAPNTLGQINTSDADVLEALPRPLFVLSLFAVIDSVSVTLQGVLRGVGEQKMGALGSLLGYYIIGLPLGYQLSLTSGLVGFWQGFTIGSACAALFNFSVYYFLDWKKIRSQSTSEQQ